MWGFIGTFIGMVLLGAWFLSDSEPKKKPPVGTSKKRRPSGGSGTAGSDGMYYIPDSHDVPTSHSGHSHGGHDAGHHCGSHGDSSCGSGSCGGD